MRVENTVVLPVWDADVDGPREPNPLMRFVREYIEGGREIVWTRKTFRLPDPDALDARQVAWIGKCGRAVERLPRDLLISLYLYTTVLNELVQRYARTSRIAPDRGDYPPRTRIAPTTEDRLAFILQARKIVPGIDTIDDYRRNFFRITEYEWKQIAEAFMADVDASFAFMPPVPRTGSGREGLLVYRGGKDCEHVRRSADDEAYLSTTLSPSIAADFGRGKKGCVAELRVPSGRKVLPLLNITRYPAELEILLPRVKGGSKKRRTWLDVDVRACAPRRR